MEENKEDNKEDNEDNKEDSKDNTIINVLTEDTITFGKYKNSHAKVMMRDRKYCKWLITQKWFKDKYPHLYSVVRKYDPSSYFLTQKDVSNCDNQEDLFSHYKYFHLVPLSNLQITLSQDDTICYEFYLESISDLRKKILNRIESKKENVFDIKAPTAWLKKFEKKTGLKRELFKDFLNAYDLPNLPYIIEDIKKLGGLNYKGARSFLIAKEKSLVQESWWEKILRKKYGKGIASQFVYKSCVFDMIHINNNTLYECKLGFKDFTQSQYDKYLLTLNTYNLIYLVGKHSVVDTTNLKIYTQDISECLSYILGNKKGDSEMSNSLDKLLSKCNIIQVEKITDYI